MHNQTEIFLLLLVSICGISIIARKVSLSYPIAYVIGGMALALVPGFPSFQIPPHLMLLVFLPVLLTEAAYFTSLRDFKKYFRQISQLAFGLVIFTSILVAWVMQYLLPGCGWAVGLVLGAIISPPDAVAATSIVKKLKLPKRIITILEGESLINDATGLVIYKFAVAAVVTGMFSLPQASGNFVWMVVSGISIGWACGVLFIKLYPYIKEQSVEIIATFLLPYAVYILVEEMGGSGVLGVVTGGIVTGWLSPKKFSASFRLQANTVWKMVVFVMNGLVFLLIGLYFPSMATELSYIDTWFLVKAAAIISCVVIAARFLWVYVVTYGQRFLWRSLRRRDPYPPWQNAFIVSWTGMRGVVSLATALALPLTVSDGTPFPYRDLIIFLSFSVILVTLLFQGLTLPWLVRNLALVYDAQASNENWLARKKAAEAAYAKLAEICGKGDIVHEAVLERIGSHYKDRITSLGDGPNTPLNDNEAMAEEVHPIIAAENKIWQQVLEIERKEVLGLRHGFQISDEVMYELLREIDLMESRFSAAV